MVDSPLVSLQQRNGALAERTAYQQRLMLEASQAVRMIEQQSDPRATGVHSASCWERLVRSCGRGRSHRRLLDVEMLEGVRLDVRGRAAVATAESSCAAPAAAPVARKGLLSGPLGAALFGRRLAVSPAEQQLAVALQSIEQRLSQQEEKAKAFRQQAKKALAAGNKAAAIRALKMAKSCEQKVAKLGDLAIAIERQRDSLEDVGLQQSVATALGAGVKNMKKAQKALKGVEQVADDTAEMRDVAEDLSQALATLGETAFDDLSVDDDDLMAELEAMGDADEAPNGASSSSAIATSVAAEASLARLPSAPQVPIEAQKEQKEQKEQTEQKEQRAVSFDMAA